MGMTIDKAIKQLEKYTIPCGKYKEAYDLAIDTMRKYQQIEQIISKPLSPLNYESYFDQIKEVLKDGNVD